MNMNVGSHKVILKYLKDKMPSNTIFLMMVGIAGSGKTTVAHKLKNHLFETEETKECKLEIFSSDDLRQELLGDINDQSQNKKFLKKWKNEQLKL